MTKHALPLFEQARINWRAPWLAHIAPRTEYLASSTNLIEALNQIVSEAKLTTGWGRALHFIPQDNLPVGKAYEAHIAATGGVPTRLNLHDFFNACMWLTFPRCKAILNARQAEQIAENGVQHTRGMARDALTLFDENAAILVTKDVAIGQALRQFDWQNALVAPRASWDDPFTPRADAHSVVYAFGHALLDKLTQPYKAICAHTWVVHVNADWFALPLMARLSALDVLLAQHVSDWHINPRDFCPLPMLGVPYFCADNIDKTFYNDSRVFRSGRLRLMTT